MRPRGIQGFPLDLSMSGLCPSPDFYKVLVKSPQESAGTAYPILNISDGHSTPPRREIYKSETVFFEVCKVIMFS